METSTRRSFLARTLLSAIATLVVVVPLGTAVAPAAHAGTAYPYAGSSTSSVDPWGFYKRNCTSYVAWRINARTPFSNNMRGPNGKVGHFGNAGNWSANAKAIGFTVNTTPKVGSIAQWNFSETSGGYGHVAYVDRVNSDGSVLISEYNWGVKYGYSQRTVRAPRYIHIP